MKKYALLLGVAFGLASCGVYTNYIGKKYPATESPEVFVDWKDVPCDYETMGHIEASPRMFKTVEDAQAVIEQKAQEAGADAIVFTGLDVKSNPTPTATEKTEHDVFGDRTKTYTETQSSTVTAVNLTATFIKYKR